MSTIKNTPGHMFAAVKATVSKYNKSKEEILFITNGKQRMSYQTFESFIGDSSSGDRNLDNSFDSLVVVGDNWWAVITYTGVSASPFDIEYNAPANEVEVKDYEQFKLRYINRCAEVRDWNVGEFFIFNQ